MILAVVLLAIGLVAGIARGGKISNIARAEFRYPALVFGGLGVQVLAEAAAATILPELREGPMGIAVLAVSYALLIAFLVLNRRLPGAIPVGAGLLLNLVVILANGAMPVSVTALEAAGIQEVRFLQTAVKHAPMGPGTLLWFLGDVIPLPVVRTVVSVGDVVLGIGIFWMVERLVRYRPRRLA